MRSSGHATGDSRTVFGKSINGIYANQTAIVKFIINLG
jgi:hypothetical protein